MAHLDFEFRFQGAGRGRRRADDEPFRLLLVADFGGRVSRGLVEPLAGRKPLAVDVDTLDRVMARISPCVEWDDATAPGGRMRFEPDALEHFHPDHLYATLPLFRALRETRARLADPKQFAAAAAELRQAAATPADGTPAAPAEADGATLERLLGRAPSAPAPQAAAEDAVAALIRRAVAPHIVPAADPMQAQYLASVDATVAEALAAILHRPEFQALEAAWRGAAWLVSRLELGEELQLFILDASKAELAADLAAAGAELSRSACAGLLVREDAPWSLVVGAFTCGGGADDVALLAALGALARHAGAAFVAGAQAELAGCPSFAAASDPRDWSAEPQLQARWQALRSSAGAAWLALAAPRLLLRQPYGAKSDPVESLPFEEFARGRHHDHYLWGSGALACAALIGQAFTDGGWSMSPGDVLELLDLPAHSYVEDGESRLQPCAEAALPERAVDALLAAGLVPLVGSRQRNAVRLPRIQSLAAPPRPLQGPWPTN